MKSNRNPEDPSSNRKGGMPFWEKMQSKKKAVPAAKKKNFDENQPPASVVRKSMAAGEKGWDQVAQWYDQLVGDHGSDYHKNLIMPAVMARLPQLKGARVIDICCGQGFAGKLLRQAGATLVHGVDASPRLIDAARTRAVADNGRTGAGMPTKKCSSAASTATAPRWKSRSPPIRVVLRENRRFFIIVRSPLMLPP